MRIIDLLNLIAKGEEVPRKFTYGGYLWEYDIKNKMWFYYFGEGKNHRFDKLFYLNMILNDEVEIIEQEKEIEKLEKLSIRWKDSDVIIGGSIMSEDIEEVLANKINEIIDVINDMRDKE